MNPPHYLNPFKDHASALKPERHRSFVPFYSDEKEISKLILSKPEARDAGTA